MTHLEFDPTAEHVSVSSRFRVFVYGTLKPGECNYQRYCAGRICQQQQAIAYGQLFDLPLGYPAMTPGSLPVYGAVLEFDDPKLIRLLDELEDYDPSRPAAENEYERVMRPVFSLQGQALGQAWMYLMTPQQARHLGGQIIESGDWASKRSSFSSRYRPH